MVWNSLTSTFAVFVKAQLLVIYHTVHIVPRSTKHIENRNAEKLLKCINIKNVFVLKPL